MKSKKNLVIIAIVAAVIAVIAAVTLCILAFFVDGKTVDKLEAKIEIIGEVTLEKADIITSAKETYSALKGYQQKKVDNAHVLEEAVRAYDALYFGKLTSELSDVIDRSLSEFGTDSSSIGSLYTQITEFYNGADEETKALLEGFDEIKAKKESFDNAISLSHAAAVSYVKGFLEVNKDKNIEIKKIADIVQKTDDTVYHLFALSYTEDGEEKAVYSSARFSGTPSVESMLAFADRFYGTEPPLETQDALLYGNAQIDVAKVLAEID